MEQEQTPFRTLAELLALGDEKHEWIWERYCARGAKTLLSAQPKIGKSTLGCQLVGAVLAGEPYLGLATSDSAVALYLTEETNITSIAEKLVTGGVNPDDSRLRILRRVDVHGQRWPEVVLELSRRAVALRDEHGAAEVLVVLDGLSKWAGFENENDSSETERALNALDPLAEAGAAILILNHAGWTARRSRGASGIVGAVDLVLFMDGEAGSQGARSVVYQGGRLHPEPPDKLNVSMREGRLYVVGEGHNRAVANNLVRIMDLLKHGPTTADQVAHLLDVSERTARRYLQELVAGGNARRSDEVSLGKGGRFEGREVVYELDLRVGFEKLLDPSYSLTDEALDRVWPHGDGHTVDRAANPSPS
jgi:hypothetical protein